MYKWQKQATKVALEKSYELLQCVCMCVCEAFIHLEGPL